MTPWLEAAAITLVFTRGSLFDGMRSRGPAWWRELARCPLCAGVWVGFGWFVLRKQLEMELALADYPPIAAHLLVAALGNGALAAVVALTVARAWDALESRGAADDARAEAARAMARSKDNAAALMRAAVAAREARATPSRAETRKIHVPDDVVERSRRTPDPGED